MDPSDRGKRGVVSRARRGMAHSVVAVLGSVGMTLALLVAADKTSAQQAPTTASLTEADRADILAAVDRANAAQIAALQTLDTSVLDGAASGIDRQLVEKQVDQLRRAGHTQTAVNDEFTVIDITRDLGTPTHAIVQTHEIWHADTNDLATGQLVKEGQAQTSNQTYFVDYVDGGWIVTADTGALEH